MKRLGGNIENGRYRIKASLLSLLFLSLFTVIAHAQVEKKYIRQGNREYNRARFQESEVSYRRAADNNKRSPDAVFNIGDALYKQNKYEEATKHFSENIDMNEDRDKKAAGLYNLGNSLLQSDKLRESIEAYKSSLKLQPDNYEAKYNLAYAMDLLKQQEQQQQQQQKDNGNQEKQDQKNDQDKENNDQKNQDQKQDQQQNQEKQQQPQEQTISKEDAERLLNSLANDEKNVQEKVKLAKAARERKLTVKNW